MNKHMIGIATRKSPLAMAQTNMVKAALLSAHDQLTVDIVGLLTEGDKQLATPLAKIGGKALFVKELEIALLNRKADIAVHSMKDVPVDLLDEFIIAAIFEREDPRDVFVSNQYERFDALPKGARVGTSSLRRQCQLLARRPDLTIVPVRGNVGTRLRHCDEGSVDALVLAAAGLKRLGLESRIRHCFMPEDLLPAVGQGAIGIECRVDDQTTLDIITPLHDDSSATCLQAERAMNEALQGGCQVPLAGYAVIENHQLWLRGLVGTPNGNTLLRAESRGTIAQANQLGRAVAEQLIAQGAQKIIRDCNAQQ